MDDLLMIAGELLENDNYKKNDFQEETKPDGDYEIVIQSIKLKTSAEKGTQWFAFTCEVVDIDEYLGENFYVNMFLTEKTIKRTTSNIMKLVNACGYDIDLNMFSDLDNLEKGLQQLVGESVMLTKQTSGKNFINYTFSAKGGE